MANALVQHNIPLSFADHLNPLLRDIFPDTLTAKAYASASTKTTWIINGSLAPYYKSSLVELMKSQPYSIAIDGSNDSGVEKMNPITVKMFISTRGMIVTRFLDMCIMTGRYKQISKNINFSFVIQERRLGQQKQFSTKWMKFSKQMESHGATVLELWSLC